MSLKAFKKVGFEQKEVAKLQENVDSAIKRVLDAAIIDGLLLEGIELTNGQVTSIDHKLGRNLRGWLLVDKNANANVWRANTDKPGLKLNLNTSATVTVSIWVF